MSQLENVVIPQIPAIILSIAGEGKLTLAGTIATRDPAEGIAPFFRNVHQAVLADKLKKFKIDLSGLTFVNSSAIRLFVDWVTWIKNESTDKRYKAVIVLNPQVTWQKTSLGVLKSLAPDVVELQEV
jgi:hypothetical protein